MRSEIFTYVLTAAWLLAALATDKGFSNLARRLNIYVACGFVVLIMLVIAEAAS